MCTTVKYYASEANNVQELVSMLPTIPIIKAKGYKQVTGSSCLCCLDVEKMLVGTKYERRGMDYTVHSLTNDDADANARHT